MRLEKNRTFILKISIGPRCPGFCPMSDMSDRKYDALKRFSVPYWCGTARHGKHDGATRKGHTMTIDNEYLIRKAINRQAAIDSIRAFALPLHKRYVEAWNGWDAANDRILVDDAGNADMQAISDIRMEIIVTLASRGVMLIGAEEDEVIADWGIHENSDGSGARVRMICEPAIVWETASYGYIVVHKAYTIAA